MKTLLIFSIGLVYVLTVGGQDSGRYRPSFPLTTRRPSIFEGRYRPLRPKPISDGRYRPENDGRYRPAGDGRYIPGNDGKYVHVDVPGGQYTGQNGPGGPGEKPIPAPVTTTTRRPVIEILTQAPLKPSSQGKGTGEGGGGWKIIRDDNSVDTDGYHYLFETENGILAEEDGRVQPLDDGEEGLRSKGFYEYTGDDGLLYRVNYVADNNGFIPEGEHIPKAPPHVARLLAFLAANAPSNRRR